MRYVSLFSGIEAASVAWEPLGWEAVAFSEIEPFCCDLLQAHFPDVPNLGDISSIDWSEYVGTVDIVVGGSPCQAFSTAGRRRGLLDERGQLMFEYIRSVHDLRPLWVIWENVPGVLSQDKGRAFGTFIGALEDSGYSLAWRVLDSQFFGVPQRRRRVFVVGCRRNDCSPAAVLFEPHSLQWDNHTRRQTRAKIAEASARRAAGSDRKLIFSAGASAKSHMRVSDDVSPTLKAGSNLSAVPSVCYGIASTAIDRQPKNGGNGIGVCEGLSYTLTASDKHAVAIVPEKTFVCMADDNEKAAIDFDIAGTIKASTASMVSYENDLKPVVRRLMPVECERLQGFPDGWTDIYKDRVIERTITDKREPIGFDDAGNPIYSTKKVVKKGTPDAPRYKALGNSMAVPVMRWIGTRIEKYTSLMGEDRA